MYALRRAFALAAGLPLLAPGAAAACGPIEPGRGAVVDVTPAEAARLPEIVRAAPAGATVRLADGRYPVDATLALARPGLTLRSASGRAAGVVIDGAYGPSALVAVAASRVTITDVTLTRARDHLVHAVPPEGGRSISLMRLHRVRLVDSGEQFVKANPNASRTGVVDRSRVTCSSFTMTPAGRQRIERAFGCYTGGIDAHGATAWRVRRNRFEGIYCEDGEVAEHAIHFWRRSRGTLIERNVIRNCSRGIGLGLTGEPGDGHFKGVVRRNVILADVPQYDTGIELAATPGAVVVHNTVAETARATRAFSSIDVRFARPLVIVANNLVRRVTVRDGGRARLRGNIEGFPLDWLRDGMHLRPAAGAVDRGVRLSFAGRDIDGQRRRGRPDVGADELHPAP
jgi:hypothetical protein